MSTPVKADDTEAAGDDKPCPQPTIAEAYFFLNIIKFQKNKLDVDWDKVAEESGFKNAETAKVRFGQIKRKLGFNSATPNAARVRPQKRTADNGEASSAPAEKKPRKTPAKPRGKKAAAAAAASNDLTSSPTAAEDESPLAQKSAKQSYQNVAPIPSSLNAGNGYTTSPAANNRMGYGVADLVTTGTGNGFVPAMQTINLVEDKLAIEKILKQEASESEEDEEEQNARAKSELAEQISKEEMGKKKGKGKQKQQHASETHGYNDFPNLNAFAPGMPQAQASGAHHQDATASQPATRKRLPSARGQQTQSSASTAALRQTLGYGDQATTALAHHLAHGAAVQAPAGGSQGVAADVDVEEDMTLGGGRNLTPPSEVLGEESAFNDAMFGTDVPDYSTGWPTFGRF